MVKLKDHTWVKENDGVYLVVNEKYAAKYASLTGGELWGVNVFIPDMVSMIYFTKSRTEEDKLRDKIIKLIEKEIKEELKTLKSVVDII